MYGFKHFGIVELKRELEELSTSCIFEALVCLLGGGRGGGGWGKGGVHFFLYEFGCARALDKINLLLYPFVFFLSVYRVHIYPNNGWIIFYFLN